MELFIRQIRDYGFISHYSLLALIAWGLIAFEFALGIALLVSFRPRLILAITALLMLFFLGVNSWAWLIGGIEDCGCFGVWVKRTPAEGIVEDLVLFAAVCLAWIGHGHVTVPQPRARVWAVIIACIVGLILPITFGYPVSRIYNPELDAIEIELGRLEIQGLKDINLKNGEYLIVFMLTDCHHCQEGVPDLNDLAEKNDLPTVIALTPNEKWQRMEFEKDFQPVFPLGQIDIDAFLHLLGESKVPRFMLVRDLRVLKIWDQSVPAKDIIMQSLS
ncbi:MAG: hypothetical protein JRC68_01410 [Deltaproteobacteria bacterium]|nr:hypothetical protein [Deltaproteobacteria bacterium]